MSFWFRTYRENVDDPQTSMMAEMFQLILQARQQQLGSTSPTDLEKKRVTIVPTESYLIFISDGCFVIGKQRYLSQSWKWYLGREPDGTFCRCLLEFEYRDTRILDRSLRGNHALLKGYPTIIAYQPEYPTSSIQFNGTSSYVDMTNTSNLKIGETSNTELSYVFWYYFTTTPAITASIITRGSAPPITPRLGTAAGELLCTFFYKDGTSYLAHSGVSTKNVWHSAIVQHSDKDNISEVYVDGVLRDSNVKNDFLRDSGTSATSRFLIGAAAIAGPSQNQFFAGNIKRVQVFSRRITAQEAIDINNGVEVSTAGLVSEWNFDEDYNTTKAIDSQGYNTGTYNSITIDKNNIPSVLNVPIPYEDGLINKLTGYKTDGTNYLLISELQDDFRITGKTTGGLWYRWLVKLTAFGTTNGNYFRLLEKADDFTLTYIQSIQIRDDGKVYVFANFNGTTRKLRTTNALKLNKLHDIIVGIDYDSIAGGNAVNIFPIKIDGLAAATETTTVDPQYPLAADIHDRDTHLITGIEPLKGNFQGQIYKFWYCEEDITDTKALGLMANKFTTYNIDRGHVARSNMTKLPITNLYRFLNFKVPITEISDFFTFTITDLILTGRFKSGPSSNIPISDNFDFSLTAPGPTLGNYAIDLTNTTNVHSWVEVPTIDPVHDHFSVFAWVKYRGKVGDWAGIISAIDGLDNANRLLITDTQIRWHGQFDKDSSPLKDFRVTVASIANAYHLIGFTYDGDAQKFIIWLDGHPVGTFKAKGDIRGTDRSKTFIGKGANHGFYLDGLIDDLFIYKRTLSQKKINMLLLKQEFTDDLMAHYSWERTFKDVENNKFNGKAVGTVKFSSDHV